MSRFVVRLRSKIFVVLTMVLSASCLSIPTAHALDEPNVRDISVLRIDATDQLPLLNESPYVVMISLTDPVYGTQTRTLQPWQDTGDAPMCAIKADLSPDPTVYVTFNPGTASAVTKFTYYPSITSDTYSLAHREQFVTEAALAVSKVKARVAKAKLAVKKVKAVLAKAKASHRTVWIRSTSRWLAKTKAKLKVLKSKLATKKENLLIAEEDLQELQGYITYCQEFRTG